MGVYFPCRFGIVVVMEMNPTKENTEMNTEVTTAPFERSHGRSPKGHGAWAFQATTHRTGYASELTGEVEFFTGTFTEARAAARRFFNAPLIAVLG